MLASVAFPLSNGFYMETNCENYSLRPELAQSSSLHLLHKIRHHLLLPAHKPVRDPLPLHLYTAASGKENPGEVTQQTQQVYGPRGPPRTATTDSCSVCQGMWWQPPLPEGPLFRSTPAPSPTQPGLHPSVTGRSVLCSPSDQCSCINAFLPLLTQTSLKLVTSPWRYLWHVHYPASEHLEEKRLWILLPILWVVLFH